MDNHTVYSASMRADNLHLFDRAYTKIIDIGCSAGNIGAMLKAHQLCQWVTGVEAFEQTAQIVRTHLDGVIVGAVEQALQQIPDQHFDCILCLDTLEYLVDPWNVLDRPSKKLKPQRMLITNIPNIGHLSILVKFFLLRCWTYTDSGILERTHLRFFTKRSCLQLLDLRQLQLEKIRSLVFPT